jgi:acetyl-CoA carboxylase/biotin carboxylase 1
MGVPATDMAATTSGSKKQANGSPSSNAAKYDLPSHFIGGNHVGVAPQSKVKDFVQAHGGHTVITNVRRNPNFTSIGMVYIDCNLCV